MHYPFPFICLSYVKYETSKSFFSSSSLRFRFCFVSLILPSHVLKQAVLSFLSLTHRNGIFQAIWLPVFVSWEFFRINHTEAQSPAFHRGTSIGQWPFAAAPSVPGQIPVPTDHSPPPPHPSIPEAYHRNPSQYNPKGIHPGHFISEL